MFILHHLSTISIVTIHRANMLNQVIYGRFMSASCRSFVTRGYASKRIERRDDARQELYDDISKCDNTAIKDQDVFGTLSDRGRRKLATHEVEKLYPDDQDGYDKEEFSLEPRKNLYHYEYNIAECVRKRDIKQALKLYHEMKSVARLTPNHRFFSLILDGCAKVGYTSKAFEIYDEILKYQSKPSQASVNCLINACAEGPDKEYSLDRLDWLLTDLKVKFNYSFNIIHFNTIIKAYSKLGRLDEATKQIQVMLDQSIVPDSRTFQSILMGCLEDKQSGCIAAWRVLKRIKLFGYKLNTKHFNIMLRAIRDCGLGSQELLDEAIGELPAITSHQQRIIYSQRHSSQKANTREGFERLPLLEKLGESLSQAVKPAGSSMAKTESGSLVNGPDERLRPFNLSVNDRKFGNTRDTSNDVYELPLEKEMMSEMLPISNVNEMKLPNLLSDDHLTLMSRVKSIRFDCIRTKQDRLRLFGGFDGFIEYMLLNGCLPDVKTFSMIKFCIDSDKDTVDKFLKSMEDLKVEPDADFWHQLIWDICHNYKNHSRLDHALEIVERLTNKGMRPCVHVYESLALGCDRLASAKQLVTDMKQSKYSISHAMIMNFFNAATKTYKFNYLNWLIQLSVDEQFKPTKLLVEQLELVRVKFDKLLDSDRKLPEEDRRIHKKQIQAFKRFVASRNSWMKTTEVEEKEHPLAQYYVQSEWKKAGYFKFANHMKELIKQKEETLERKGSQVAMLS